MNKLFVLVFETENKLDANALALHVLRLGGAVEYVNSPAIVIDKSMHYKYEGFTYKAHVLQSANNPESIQAYFNEVVAHLTFYEPKLAFVFWDVNVVVEYKT